MNKTLLSTCSVLIALALVGCSSASPTTDDQSTPPSATSDDTTSATGSSGCELVTPEMITAALGADPGTPVEEPSLIGGPASCKYEVLAADVQVSNEPDVYFPVETSSGADVDGSVPVPGADRGYVTDGGFLIVKGNTAVFVTALAVDATLEQWQALAEATLAKL